MQGGSTVTTVAPRGVRPSGWWYLVPVGLVVFSIVAAVQLVRSGFEDAQRVGIEATGAAPGEDQPITIREPGSFTVAFVGPESVRSTHEQEQLADDLDIRIVDAGSGEVLPLTRYEGLNDIVEDGQQYVPLWTIRFERPGEYVLRSARLAGIDPDRSGLVVHESPFRKLRDGVERAGATLVVGTLLAILVAVILARMRGRSKRAQPPPVPWGGPSGYVQPGYAAPGYGPPGQAQPGYVPPGYRPPW
ncbi:MAG: hypothetical protein GXY13_02495 [Acidimicrobiales bacterium]|nr:hypothetical protein [Acidimicrobiales bacterium]